MAADMERLAEQRDPMARIELARFRFYYQQRADDAIALLNGASANAGRARCAIDELMWKIKMRADPTGATALPFAKEAANRGAPIPMHYVARSALEPRDGSRPDLQAAYHWYQRATSHLVPPWIMCDFGDRLALGMFSVANRTSAEAAFHYYALAHQLGFRCSDFDYAQGLSDARVDQLTEHVVTARMHIKPEPEELGSVFSVCTCVWNDCAKHPELVTHCSLEN